MRESDSVVISGASITGSRFEASPPSSTLGSSTRTMLPDESRIIRPKPFGSVEVIVGPSEPEDRESSIVKDGAIGSGRLVLFRSVVRLKLTSEPPDDMGLRSC